MTLADRNTRRTVRHAPRWPAWAAIIALLVSLSAVCAQEAPPNQPPPAEPAPPKADGSEKAEQDAPEAEAPPPAPPLREPTPKERHAARRALIEGDRHLRARRFADAEELYVNAVELDPGSLYARHRLADALLAQGKRPQAAAIYERVVAAEERRPGDATIQQSAAEMLRLAARLTAVERGGALLELELAEHQAFRDQAEREALINREEQEYGEALRAAGFAEWLGRGIGDPLPGSVYNDLLKEGLRTRLDEKNLPATAGLLDVADHLSIHSAECAALEREYIRVARGEAQKVAIQAAPLIAALDEEVMVRRAEEEIRDRERRKRRMAKLTAAFTALVEGVTGHARYRAIIGDQAPVLTAAVAGEQEVHVHKCPRHLDYGKIAGLNEADRVTYALQPMLFKMTPSQWRARAIITGYEPHEPALPQQVKAGTFILGLETDVNDTRHYYFRMRDTSDKKAKVIGRWGTAADLERALEFYYLTDPKYTPGTIKHE